jgi:ankyrin repeat protein
VNLIDANGRTPLHYAIELQSDAAVLALLKLGANPDVQTGSGQSPREFCQDALKQVPDYAVCRKMLDSLR